MCNATVFFEQLVQRNATSTCIILNRRFIFQIDLTIFFTHTDVTHGSLDIAIKSAIAQYSQLHKVSADNGNTLVYIDDVICNIDDIKHVSRTSVFAFRFISK